MESTVSFTIAQMRGRCTSPPPPVVTSSSFAGVGASGIPPIWGCGTWRWWFLSNTSEGSAHFLHAYYRVVKSHGYVVRAVDTLYPHGSCAHTQKYGHGEVARGFRKGGKALGAFLPGEWSCTRLRNGNPCAISSGCNRVGLPGCCGQLRRQGAH